MLFLLLCHLVRIWQVQLQDLSFAALLMRLQL